MLALEKPVGLDDNEEVDAEGDIRDGHPAYNRRNVSKEKKEKDQQTFAEDGENSKDDADEGDNHPRESVASALLWTQSLFRK